MQLRSERLHLKRKSKSTGATSVKNRDVYGADGHAGLDGFAFNPKRRKAHGIWTREQWQQLAFHLHNNNDDRRFVIGFNGKRDSPYVRNKSKRVDQVVSWAWDTITGRAKSPVAFVPYSQNHRGESRWGAIDFDAHNGEPTRAEEFARAAFRVLLNHDGIFLILETTGSSGGWHLWAIAPELRPVEKWTLLLCGVCEQIGVQPCCGICEIYPPAGERSEYGRAVRAPGSWHPKGGFSEIVFQNASPLLNALAECTTKGAHGPLGKPPPSALWGNSLRNSDLEFPEKRKKLPFSSPSPLQDPEWTRQQAIVPLYHLWIRKWCNDFAIALQGTRNAQVGRLTGTIFYQVGREMAERIAIEQFHAKLVSTKASLSEHLADFSNYWRGLERRWRARLSVAEQDLLDALPTEINRDAFRIVKNYSRLAVAESRKDFPIVRNDLAARLGITGAGAGKMRLRFCRMGIIRHVKDYQPNRTAARYIWTANG